MASSNGTVTMDSRELSLTLEKIKREVEANRAKSGDSEKSLKDFRRIFDQESSQINQAIFNEAPIEQVYIATLRTVTTLIEIMTRTEGKKDIAK